MRPIALLAVAAAVAAAPPPETNAQRGTRVVNEALKALGGEKFLTLQDRVEAGRAYSFYREQLSGLSRAKIYTRYLTRPEPPVPGFIGIRERESFGPKEDSAVLFTGTEGYEITFRGARPIADDVYDRWKLSTLSNIFYILRMRMGEPGLTFDSRGADIMDNQPVEIVDITDSDNRTVTVYFNQTTRLPVRQVWFRRDPLTKDRIEEETLFSKYRNVSGIQWPYDIQRQRNGEMIYQIYADSVTIDQNLKDDLFTLPANMKILKKEK